MAEEEGNFFTDVYDDYIKPGWEATKKIGQEFSDATGLGWDDARNAAKFAAAGYLNKTGFTDQEMARSGYQGKVPKFTAVRERVPFTNDPNRRPGSGGRRYFTGTRYIGDPSGASGLPSQRQELYGVERMDEDMSAGGLEYLKARQEALQPAIDEVERVKSEILAAQDRYGLPRGTTQIGSRNTRDRQLIADKLGVGVGDPAVETAVTEYNSIANQSSTAESTLARARGEFDNFNMDPTGRLSRYGADYDPRGTYPLSSIDPALGHKGIGSSFNYMFGVEGSTGISPYMNYTIDDGYIKDAEGNIIDATGSRVAKFGDPTVGTEYYDDVAQTAYKLSNPDAQFNPDGYLLTPAENPKQLGSLYTDEGYAISTPAKDFTNYEVARGVGQQEAMGLAAINAFNPYSGSAGNTSPTPFPVGTSPYFAAGGGVKQLAGGRYLDGMTDGMADEVPSSIDGVQPAALSDGEFVIPADVVSHLGNGSSNAGAKVLNDMMSNVRETRTGNPEQGKQINPQRVMQSSGLGNFANGGQVKKFNTGDTVNNTIDSQPGLDLTTGDNGSGDNGSDPVDPNIVDPNNASGSGDKGDDVVDDSGIDIKTGYESSLSNWVGDYVTDMLGRGEALSKRDYEAYYGPLTAGEDYLQRQAYDAAAGIDTSGAGLGSFTADRAAQYMNPFVQQALEPQLREARRQAEIDRLANAGRMTQAGSYGGSRQAILEAEGLRNLGTKLGDITAEGYQTAYDKAAQQFGDDRQFGLDALQQQADMGASRRDILAEGIAADKAQFEEERDYDYKAVQYLQSLLQDLPIKAQSYDFAQPSDAADIAGLVSALGGADNIDILDTLLAIGGYGVDKVGEIFGGGSEPGTLDVYGVTYTYNDKPAGVSVSDWTAAIDSGDPDQVANLIE
jgi:hypothetical protein